MEWKYDFLKSGDRQNIVDFVREVEKYPCLYDKTLPEYANKVHNRRAWANIAKKANTSIPDCRDKWRKIRIAYMRSLKQQQSDTPPIRRYYLTEELQFLTPFLIINPLQADSQKESKMEFEVAQVNKQESESDSSDYFEQENEEVQQISPVSFRKMPNIVNIRSLDHKNDNNKTNLVRNVNNNENTPKSIANGNDSHRKMFLLSIMPEVEAFSEQEMRIFRRELINVVDNIINKRGY